MSHLFNDPHIGASFALASEDALHWVQANEMDFPEITNFKLFVFHLLQGRIYSRSSPNLPVDFSKETCLIMPYVLEKQFKLCNGSIL